MEYGSYGVSDSAPGDDFTTSESHVEAGRGTTQTSDSQSSTSSSSPVSRGQDQLERVKTSQVREETVLDMSAEREVRCSVQPKHIHRENNVDGGDADDAVATDNVSESDHKAVVDLSTSKADPDHDKTSERRSVMDIDDVPDTSQTQSQRCLLITSTAVFCQAPSLVHN